MDRFYSKRKSLGELFRVEEGSQSSSVERKLASAIINFIAVRLSHQQIIIITLKICTYVFNTCIQTPSLYATFSKDAFAAEPSADFFHISLKIINFVIINRAID